jgi:hypothetical protein
MLPMAAMKARSEIMPTSSAVNAEGHSVSLLQELKVIP